MKPINHLFYCSLLLFGSFILNATDVKKTPLFTVLHETLEYQHEMLFFGIKFSSIALCISAPFLSLFTIFKNYSQNRSLKRCFLPGIGMYNATMITGAVLHGTHSYLTPTTLPAGTHSHNHKNSGAWDSEW